MSHVFATSGFLSYIPRDVYNRPFCRLFTLIKIYGPFFCFSHASRFVASCTNCPMGKFRGHDLSAALKSN
jgi:hypothetical protein